MRRKHLASTLGILAAAATQWASGQTPLPVYDPFNYSSGNLNGDGGWQKQVNGGVQVDSTQNVSYQYFNPSTGGVASLDTSATGVNAEKLGITGVGTTTVGSVYFSFTLQVTDISNLTTSSIGDPIAGFNNSATSSGLSGGSTWIRLRRTNGDSNANTWQLGMVKAATDINVSDMGWDAGGHNANDPAILVVGRYVSKGDGAPNNSDDEADFWVNPAVNKWGLPETNLIANSAPTFTSTTGTDAGVFDFFLNNESDSGVMQVDDVRVANSWAQVTPFIWKDTDGNWGTDADWYTGLHPDGVGPIADFAQASAAHTVDLASTSRTAGGLIFGSTNGYSITSSGGGVLGLNSDTSISVNVTAGNNTISAPVQLAKSATFAIGSGASMSITNSISQTATAGLIESGGGMLTLSASNSYTGGSTISGGTLRVTDDSNLGTSTGLADNIVLDGGTLQLGNNMNINANRIIDITANGGTINTDASQTDSYGSTLAFRLPGGAGTGGPLTKTGAGTFNYQGGYQNSYSALNVQGGTFQFGKADELPAGTITLNGGAVRVLQGFSAGNPLSVGVNNGTFDTTTHDVTLSGSVTGTGTLHKTGSSRLITNGVQLGGLSVDQGAVFTSPGRSAAKLSKLGSLSVAGGASMDLYDNDLIIDYSGSSPDPAQLSSAQALIKRGYANGAWTGDGLTSSQAQNLASTTHRTALGYAEASTVSAAIGGTFDGASLDNSMILVRYTYSGDANLDGSVDSSDFDLLAANFGKTGQYWNAGDFNYDGTVNALDFNALATNYGQLEAAPLPGAVPGDVVPEPGSIALLGSAAIMLISRRRRSLE